MNKIRYEWECHSKQHHQISNTTKTFCFSSKRFREFPTKHPPPQSGKKTPTHKRQSLNCIQVADKKHQSPPVAKWFVLAQLLALWWGRGDTVCQLKWKKQSTYNKRWTSLVERYLMENMPLYPPNWAITKCDPTNLTWIGNIYIYTHTHKYIYI